MLDLSGQPIASSTLTLPDRPGRQPISAFRPTAPTAPAFSPFAFFVCTLGGAVLYIYFGCRPPRGVVSLASDFVPAGTRNLCRPLVSCRPLFTCRPHRRPSYACICPYARPPISIRAQSNFFAFLNLLSGHPIPFCTGRRKNCMTACSWLFTIFSHPAEVWGRLSSCVL